MKGLIVSIVMVISFSTYGQECITEWENKPNILVDRFSKELKGVSPCGVEVGDQFMMTFVRVEEVKSKKSHYAIQFSHWDNKKDNDHKLATAYVEKQELSNFQDALDFCINKNDTPKGSGNHSYSYMTHSGLKLYCYYANSGWHNYLIFENYNDLRIKLCYDDLVKLKQRLEIANPLIVAGKYDEL